MPESNTAKSVSNEGASGKEPPSTCTTDSKKDYDPFDLKLKPEYVLDKLPSSWTELPRQGDDRDSGDRRDNNNDRRGKGKGNNNKNKKKRPRDDRTPNCEKVCLAVLRGEECPYGTSCKFSHDLQAYLKTRPEDITTVEDGCPNFHETGYCLFGASCRLGSCHLIKSTGENLRKEGVVAPPPVQNNLPKEVLLQLRKKKFSFKNKRVDSQQKSPGDKTVESSNSTAGDQVKKETDATEHFKTIHDPFRPSLADKPFNSTPMPSKTKKIIDFSNKVYVAPLTTVGNLPFRRIMKRFGADITCGEMAVAGNLLDGKPSEWALLKRHPEEDIFGVQIASGYPDAFTRVCEVIEQHLEVDFVDMNLGCPLDIICNRGAGSALMLREKKLKCILEGITSTLSCPVTIKMRTGYDKTKPFAHQLVAKIQSWGIDGIGAVMVHGRSRLQRYQNNADWDYISTVAQSQDESMTKLHLVGNGDILSYTDHEEKTARQGISSAAMLARGALIKPWLPTEIKERRHWDISASERLDILKDFVKFGLTHWGSDQQGVDNTRRFLLEWLNFLYRYVPVGLLERVPQEMNQRPPQYMCGRSDLETLFMSPNSDDWIKISEMLLGPAPDGFRFEPKHKSKSY